MNIIIKHRRFASASKRALYLESEKEKVRDQGRLNYIASGGGERVLKLWGCLPNGVEVKAGVDIGSALLIDNPVSGRSEVIEWLVSAAQDAPRAEAQEFVIKIVNALMAKHFPDGFWVAALHGDGNCIHAHVDQLNRDSKGRAISIPKKKFLEIRRDISTWSGLDVQSAWPAKNLARLGKEIERQFAQLKKAEMVAEVESGNIIIHKRNKKTNAVRTVLWRKGEVGEIIRFWTLARLESRLDYELTEIEIAISRWNKKQDKEKAAKILNDSAIDRMIQRQIALLPPAVQQREAEFLEKQKNLYKTPEQMQSLSPKNHNNQDGV